MASQENILRFQEYGSKNSVKTSDGMHGIRQRTVGTPGFKSGGFGRPQHLIGLLLAHGSRARRNSLARTNIRISVFTPSGKSAIKIRV